MLPWRPRRQLLWGLPGGLQTLFPRRRSPGRPDFLRKFGQQATGQRSWGGAGTAWARRHYVDVRVRHGEMRLATLILAEPWPLSAAGQSAWHGARMCGKARVRTPLP